MSQTRRSTLARPLPESFRKSCVSASGMWKKAVLSAPYPDLAGDVVLPGGIDFTLHKADPSVDLEHGRTPEVRGMPVAWGRESLSEPGAPYAVEWASLNFAEADQPDDYQTVPICTSYFDKSCKVSTQVFALVEQDALPAVSIEFAPVPGFLKSLGRSPLEPRDAYRFEKCRLVRWSICERGVCPHALSLVGKSLTQVPGALGKILRDGRVNVGGTWEKLHPLIRKALAPAEATAPKSTVRVGKAMTDYDDTPDDAQLETADMQAVDDMGMDDGMGMGDEMPALGGVSAKYKLAQRIDDAVAEYEQDMQSSDSPELRAMAEEIKAEARKLAAKVKLIGDRHDAKLNGHTEGEAPDAEADAEGGDKPEGDDAEGDEGDEFAGKGKAKAGEEDDEPDMEKDEEGTFKAVRRPYKSILKAVKRFSVADVRKAQEAAARRQREQRPDEPDPTEDTAGLSQSISRLEELLSHLN